MHCPYCKHEISENANFCEQCGKKIPKCPTCGHIIWKKENFCPMDGTPLPSKFFADWPLEEVSLSEEITAPEDPQQESTYSEMDTAEPDITDEDDYDEDFDEDFDDFEDYDDYDESEESEKTNWKPILIAAAIIGVICVFASYIAIVTGPGTLKKDQNIHVEASAKQSASQEADTVVIFQHSNYTLLLPQNDTML